jgi:hypothetical protein
VAAQTREGKTERFYFDAATHLPSRLDLWEQGPEGARVEGEFLLAEYRLEDYRRVDGMMLPFRIVRVRPRSTIEYRFNEIKHDVEVDDQTFTPPPQKSKQ